MSAGWVATAHSATARLAPTARAASTSPQPAKRAASSAPRANIQIRLRRGLAFRVLAVATLVLNRARVSSAVGYRSWAWGHYRGSFIYNSL